MTTPMKDTDIMIGDKISYEVAKRNVHIAVIEMKNRDLIRKNNMLQAEKIRALNRSIERQREQARRMSWLIPVIGMVIFLWDALGWCEDAMEDFVDGLADINRHRVRRGSDAWDIAEGLKTR